MRKTMNFGKALELLKLGRNISREAWDSREKKYLQLNKGIFDFKAAHEIAGGDSGGGVLMSVAGMHPALFVDLETAMSVFPSIQMVHELGNRIYPYTFPHEDILADDWFVKE